MQWESNLLQLLEHAQGQETGAALSLHQHVQIVARSWIAHAPVKRMQYIQLSQLELLRADVEQCRILSRVGDGAIDDEFEALQRK